MNICTRQQKKLSMYSKMLALFILKLLSTFMKNTHYSKHRILCVLYQNCNAVISQYFYRPESIYGLAKGHNEKQESKRCIFLLFCTQEVQKAQCLMTETQTWELSQFSTYLTLCLKIQSSFVSTVQFKLIL